MITSNLFTPFSIKLIHLDIWCIYIYRPTFLVESYNHWKSFNFSAKNMESTIKKYVQSHSNKHITISIPYVFIINMLKNQGNIIHSHFILCSMLCHWLSISFVLTYLYTCIPRYTTLIACSNLPSSHSFKTLYNWSLFSLWYTFSESIYVQHFFSHQYISFCND